MSTSPRLWVLGASSVGLLRVSHAPDLRWEPWNRAPEFASGTEWQPISPEDDAEIPEE